MVTHASDRWAEWLLRYRQGDSPSGREQLLQQLAPIRDRVLADADIQAGERVLDVGCGDGLIGFGAADLVGPDGIVIFSDVSLELLEICRSAAAELKITDRCEFLHTELPDLKGVPDQSVDAVTMRSVLIYVADKSTALANLHRVLRPAGRLALFEPINRFSWPGPDHELWGLDVTGLEQLVRRVKGVCRQYAPETETMVDFDERDLLRWTQQAGFTRLRLDYRVEISNQAPPVPNFDALLDLAPNPLTPTYREMLHQALSEPDYIRLLNRLRERFHSGVWQHSSAVVHLAASRT